jgi:hypothetical protein
MRSGQVFAVFAALCFRSNPAPAEPLQPTGKWTIHSTASHCVLSRDYGSAGKPLILNFQKMPLRDALELVVSRKARSLPPNHGTVVQSTGATKTQDSRFIAYDAIGGVRRIAFGLEPEVSKAAAISGVLALQVAGELNEHFAVPEFDDAFQALDACAMNLGKSWGIPIEHQKQVKQGVRAVGPISSYFGSDDYPRSALLDRTSGISGVQVSVDQNGKPTNCIMRPSTGVASLDERTCGIFMNRVHFTPAINLEGQPVASFYVNEINWLMLNF